MQRPSLRIAVAAASLVLSVSAQTGNEVVFVASSTSGSADQHAFVESATGTIVQATGNSYTDNVTGAAWADTGRKLYVGQGLMDRVAVADWNGSSATWSTFYQSSSACYGVEFDRIRNRVWTLTGSSSGAGARELVCLEGDPNSPNYGNVIAATTSLSGASRERWCLSYTGNLACVPEVFIGGNAFTLVDTDPSSTNYLQVIASAPILGAAGAGFSFCSDCKISLDEQYAYVLWTGISGAGLAMWDMQAQAWVDFGAAPGHQDLMISLSVPNKMDLSLDRTFAVLSGQGGSGWAARIDFDYTTPSNTTITQYTGLTVPDCNGISLSPDGTRAAVSSTATFLSTPSELTVFDVNTGAVLSNTVLSAMWNVYTTAWQDASPVASYETFGSGCNGTLGVPTLSAAPTSRPALGTTFDVELNNLPFGIAAMASGLSSSVTSGGLPLPLDLTVIGMTGCSQLVDAMILDLVSDPGSSGTWSWAIPNNPNIFGFTFFNQAFVLDPAANSFGFTATNAGMGTLGF